MPEPCQRVIEMEMGLTPDEFRHLLPAAVEGRRWEEADRGVRVLDSDWVLSIQIEARRPRRIGMLELPVTAIRMTFSGGDADRITRFMERFHLHYQRGGG